MAVLAKAACPVMGSPAGFHTNKRRGELCDKGHHLHAIEPFAQFLAVCRRSNVVSISPECSAETSVFAGDEPCHGEARRYATARLNVLQSTIN